MSVKKGDTVVVEYEGRLESGEVFDSSKKHDAPLTFEVGAHQVIPGFENALEGMQVGEEKEITIHPEQAYGERREELQQKIPKAAMQFEKDPEAGMVLNIQAPNGQQVQVPIVAVDDESITIDMNHPLAGHTLIFKIKLLEIKN